MKKGTILTTFVLLFCIHFFTPSGLFSQDTVIDSQRKDSVSRWFPSEPILNFNQEQLSGLPFQNLSSFGMMAPSGYRMKDRIMHYHGISTYGNGAFVDGMYVNDASDFPVRIIDNYNVYTRGVPINNGFFSSAVTSIGTISSSEKTVLLFDINTEQAAGMNAVEGEFFASILLGSNKNKEVMKRLPSLLIAGKYSWTNNNDPVWKHTQYLKEEKRQWLIDNPLRRASPTNGVQSNTMFLTAEDFVDEQQVNNNGRTGLYPFVKLDIPLSNNLNVSLGNYSVIDMKDIYNNQNYLFNYDNNNVRTRQNFDNYLSVNHKVFENDELQISYNLNFQYSNYYTKISNPYFDKNFFEYGYAGKYTAYQMATYELGSDSVDGQYYQNVWLQNSLGYDTLITFEQSNINPPLSTYPSAYFNIFSDEPIGHYQNMSEIILGGGLINGMDSGITYGMFNNYGNVNTTYRENNIEKIRASFFVEAKYKIHQFILGGEYNREKQSYYSISPSGLWSIMRDGLGLTNFHLRELDTDNPFLVIHDGHVDTIQYFRKYDGNAQKTFDKNLRLTLGLPVDGIEYILTDSYDMENNTIDYYDKYGVRHTMNTPENLFHLGLFSAPELLNDGHTIVNYSGYDYSGNKMTESSDPYAFFEDFTINPFEPQYWSAYLQDEFNWKNLHVKLGLRVDVYDANQPVLNDEYSLFEVYSAKEALELGQLNFNIPENIGDDYAVYVDKNKDPTRVLGFRKGGKWYNSHGVEVRDPDAFDVGNGVSPYVKYPEINNMSDEDWTPEMSFTEYKKTINILPQISIDYTIANRVNIYTSFSSSTYNPTIYNDFRPDQYYYLQGYRNGIISNPALVPMRTGKLFTGIRVKALKSIIADVAYLSTSIDNYIYENEVKYAYPYDYITLVNEEKRITTHGVELKLNYVNELPSGLSAGINYTRLFPREEDLPSFQVSDMVLNMNLGYMFGRGSYFKGASWMNPKIFQGLSANIFYQYRNGVQYTAKDDLVHTHIAISPHINIFNLNIQKDFIVAGKAKLNVFLVIENLFNFKNVLEVYPESGEADDDGYLSDPTWQNQINNQLNPDSFRLLYKLGLYNPQHYGIPRIWRVGLTFRY